RSVGANSEVPVDVRILSATHKDLDVLVAEGKFRHDLFYRINVIELDVPPLRERAGDLPLLSEAILKRLAYAMKRRAPELSSDALSALERYPFLGNVRELENVLERALAMADGETITAGDLRLPATVAPAPAPAGTPAPTPMTQQAPPPMVADPRTSSPRDTSTSALPSYIEEIERSAIQQALQEHRYNKTKTAAALGITFRALRYKLKKLGIE
ncbi:MAG: sigma-54-dependent Fis family transcriptional regulator, partial [Lysobacteraceae bacterium]